MSRKPFLPLLLIFMLFVTACSAGIQKEENAGEAVDGPQPGEPEATSVEETEDEFEPKTEVETLEPTPEYECGDPFEGEEPGFYVGYWEETNFCQHSVPYSEIFSGGPPPDGIPPIDEPSFVEVSAADEWLEDQEPVIFITIDGDARAYPLQIMTWHEIVNDTVGGIPVAVTFCPLCNTGLVFERPTIEGETLTFGTSGNLRNSDLVMYDRQTESWWQQFTGEAIVGDLTGTQLAFIPSGMISWADYKTNYPDGKVLSRDTGHNRDYGRNPYVGYDDVNASPFLFSGEVDDRLRPMDRVVGVLLEEKTGKAYPYLTLQEDKVINDTLEGTPLVVFWKPGTASALDTQNIPEGADVGSTAVYEAVVEDQTLTFTSLGEGEFQDEQTGTTWNFLGEALEGPLAGNSLEPIPHHDTFWFAWGAFLPPDTLVEE